MRGSDASLNENERITNPKRRFNADRNARRFSQGNAGLSEIENVLLSIYSRITLSLFGNFTS